MSDADSLDWLEGNLTALAAVDPDLAERLCLPVVTAHVVTTTGGEVELSIQQSRVRLSLRDDEARALVEAVPEGSDVLVFGAGLGEIPRMLADRQGVVTVWDRDPAILRAMLAAGDFAGALAAGRLRLALGGDLMKLPLGRRGGATTIHHPVLGRLYRNERALLEGGEARRALVGAGGLFVDDVAEALRACGYGVFIWDAERLAVEESALLFARVRPELVIIINHTAGVAEFCEARGVPLICWEIDPTLERLAPPGGPIDGARVFTYRRAHVADFQAAGWPRTRFLPLASNPTRRQPPVLSEEDRQRYRAPVAYVGASLVDRTDELRAEFIGAYIDFHTDGGSARSDSSDAAREGAALLDRLLAAQREDFSRYLVPDRLRAWAPAFREAGKNAGARDVEQIAGELAAGEKRITYAAALVPHGLGVWGDPGWRDPRTGAAHRGSAGHFIELNKIYGVAAINVDIGRLYQMDIVTMRVFDVLACGGFLLAERSPALGELFTVGVELDVYADRDELLEKVRHYLQHPEQAARMAAAGRARVLRDHTILGRVTEMLGESLPKA